jgi:DNA invertase Pin-like site-specific DNA recombinase
MARPKRPVAGDPHNGKYVALYRVSTEEQGDSRLGIEAQQAKVRGHLNGGRWQLVAEFEEVGSGRARRRPVLLEALEAARKQGATLIVSNLDRLGRSPRWLSPIQIALSENKMNVVCCDMPGVDGTAAGRMLFNQLCVFAQFEAERISERTSAALQAAKRRGVKLGSADPVKAAKASAAIAKAEANDFCLRVAPIIQDIERQLGDASLRDIARHLTLRGVATQRGGEWHAKSVANVKARMAALRSEKR